MTQSDESAVTDGEPGLREVAHSLWRFWDSSKRYVVDWVKRRNILAQFVIAGAVAEGVGRILESADGLPAALVAEFDSTQLLLAILGVLITQTAVQTRKFNQLRDESGDMDRPVRSDGGRREMQNDRRTSGGGALGGAIAGGALGAAYGPQVAVAGAILGAILGDNLEDDSRRPQSRSPRERHD